MGILEKYVDYTISYQEGLTEPELPSSGAIHKGRLHKIMKN